jgi:tetratricopeptide (TPR) repeat protein
MNWQEQLQEYQRTKDWDRAIDLMNQTIATNHVDKWAYIQAIYLFHNILLEEDYPDEKQESLASSLQRYFEESQHKFSTDPEYLFFIGKILHIAEWYFGLGDNSLAISFQKKALDMKQDSLLYEWAYRLSCTGDQVADYIAYQLVTNEVSIIEWLKSKGFPGYYILEHLMMSHERYINTKTRNIG